MQKSTEQPIVSRAIEISAAYFAERGYQATATRDISRALGMTNGTFYHHFPSKELLLVQICRASINRMIEAVGAAVAEAQNAEDKLAIMIRAHVTTSVSIRDLRITTLTQRQALGPENAAEINRLANQYRGLIESVIAEGQKAGLIRTDLGAATMAVALLNLLNYQIIRSNNERVPDINNVADALAEAKTMATIFLHGAAVR